METSLILKNLDNGTITKDAAIELLAEHAPPRYVIGAYLETRIQRDQYIKELYPLQDETQRPTMRHRAVVDLIDHALNTDHITEPRAQNLLIMAGMDATPAIHHTQTILAIKDRDLERVAYLDDPENAPRYCTRCGRKVTAKDLSRRGICVECSAAAIENNLIGLTTKTGPAYTRWRNAILIWANALEDQEIAERHPIDAGTLGDYIDHDKYPGCDAECDLCPDTECPYRNTVTDL